MSQWDGELLFLTHAVWFVSAIIAAIASCAGAWRSFRNGKKLGEVDKHLNGTLAKLLEEAEKVGYDRGLDEGERKWRERR